MRRRPNTRDGLTASYLVALTIVAALSFGAFLSLSHVITQQRDASRTINVAGRQRMLSQRVALYATRLEAATRSSAADTLRAELLAGTALLERSHRALLRGDAQLDVSGTLPAPVRRLMLTGPRSVDRLVRGFVADARTVAGSPRSTPASTAALARVQAAAAAPLLERLDRVVTEYESASRREIDAIVWLERAALALTLLTLAAEATLIFRPLVRRVRRERGHLIEAEERTRAIVEAAQEAILTIDEAGRVTSVNPAGERVTGLPSALILGRPVTLVPEVVEAGSGALATLLAGGVGRRELQRDDGDRVPVEVTAGPLESTGGWVVAVRDASDRVAVARVARKIAVSQDARAEVCQAACTVAGAAGAALYELRDHELVRVAAHGTVDEHLCISTDPDGHPAAAAYATGGRVLVEDPQGRGTALYQSVTSESVRYGVLGVHFERAVDGLGDRAAAMIDLLADEAAISVSQADQLHKLTSQAQTDPLTGLPNRRAWELILDTALRDVSTVAVLPLDLNDFKVVNDHLGHQAGDRLLREAATAWRSTLRATDCLARLGGDEFGVILRGVDPPVVRAAVSRLHEVTPAGPGVSIGWALAAAGEAAATVVGRADAAMYAEKRSRPAVRAGRRGRPASGSSRAG